MFKKSKIKTSKRLDPENNYHKISVSFAGKFKLFIANSFLGCLLSDICWKKK